LTVEQFLALIFDHLKDGLLLDQHVALKPYCAIKIGLVTIT